MPSRRRTTPLRTPFLVMGLALIGLAVTPSLAAAGEPEKPTSAAAAREASGTSRSPGYDISYPQCGGPFPTSAGFSIVGVNGGLVYKPNPCLAEGDGPSQLAWAGPHVQLYANTGNPGPELSDYWPHGQTEPRECDTPENPGADTAACAYDYGWNAAADSYRTAVQAFISLGVTEEDATRTPKPIFWWLDVETGNSWRSEPELNVAVLQGAVDYLESVDVAGVGFYSTQRQWNAITGGTLAFAEYPAWHAGAVTRREAQRNCGDAAFTGGELVLTQYFDRGFDANYRCT